MSARILLVDDHQMWCEGLRALLERQPGMEVVGTAGDGRTAVQQVRELRPDLVIMDVNMPGLDGIDATRGITQDYPGTKVLALSMYLRKAFVREMFKNGAAGYLLKENAFAEVVEAIQIILAGEKYASRQVVALLVGQDGPGPVRAPAAAPLTESETTLVRMLANGRTSKEIAAALNASVKTVDAHRRQVMRKLALESVAALVKYAIREGLTTADV